MSRNLSSDLMKMARIPKLYWDAKIEKIPDQVPHKEQLIEELCRTEELHSAGTGLVLLGDYRTGKTAAGCAFLKAVIASGRSGLMIRHNELREIEIEGKTTWQQGDMSDRLETTDWLLIDDVGRENTSSKGGEFDKKVFEETIRKRVDDKKPTLLTTNLKKGKFLDLVGGLEKVFNSYFKFIRLRGIDWSRV